MSPEELNIRLTKLETATEEKWIAHKEHSDMRWDEVKGAMALLQEGQNKITNKLEDVPCGEQKEKIKSLGRDINRIWKFIFCLLGSSGVLTLGTMIVKHYWR